MKNIYIILFLILPFYIYSNDYIYSESNKNEYKLEISTGINRLENHDEDLYRKLRWLETGNVNYSIVNFYESFICVEFSKRVLNIFFWGMESGVLLVNNFLEEKSYEMISIPLSSVIGLQYSHFQVSFYTGFQACFSDDFLVGCGTSFPFDIGLKLSYRGLQTRFSYLFADEKSFRRGLVLSIGYSLLLM